MTITVTGTEDGPVISGSATGTVSEDNVLAASGRLTASDADSGDTPTFTAQSNTTGTYGSFSLDASGNWTYSLDNDSTAVQGLDSGQRQTETFTVVSTTADGEQVARSVTINIDGLDEPIVTEPDSDSTPTPEPEPETPSGGDDTGDGGDGQSNVGDYVNVIDDLDDDSGTGDTGDTGTGDLGDTGDTGTGDLGDTGDTGTGDLGDTGDTGTGDLGDTGDTGTGDLGDTGDTGTGDLGDTGDTGTGDLGDTGDTGTGDAGDTGDTGAGDAGDTGDTGTGDAGDTGDTGGDDAGSEGDGDGDGDSGAEGGDEGQTTEGGDSDAGGTGTGTGSSDAKDQTESGGGGSDTDSSPGDNSFELILDGGIEDKVFEVNESFKFQIPANAFAIRVNADAPLEQQPEITLKATLANGNPLPQWMKFNPETATFTGTPPDGAEFVEVKVVATTEDGQEADATFTILLHSGEMPAGTGEQLDAPVQEGEGEETPETSAWKSEARESLAALELMGLGITAGVSVTGISTLATPSQTAGVSRELRTKANDFTEKCAQFLRDLGLDDSGYEQVSEIHDKDDV